MFLEKAYCVTQKTDSSTISTFATLRLFLRSIFYLLRIGDVIIIIIIITFIYTRYQIHTKICSSIEACVT